MGWVVNATPRPLYPRERDPVPIVQEAGWAPGQVWKGAENLACSGIRSPDRPARSGSLYRLSYLDPPNSIEHSRNININLHAQDTTAFNPNVVLIVIYRLLIINI